MGFGWIKNGGIYSPIIFFVSNICFSGFLCYNVWDRENGNL